MPRLPLALLLLASVIVLVPSSPQTAADERDRLKVGLQPDGRIVVPTNQILQPAGTQVTFPGRPVDLLLVNAGRTLVAKNMRNLVFIDAATGKIEQMLRAAGRQQGTVRRVQRGGASRSREAAYWRPTRRTRSGSRTARFDGTLQWDGHIALKAPGSRRRGLPDRAWHSRAHKATVGLLVPRQRTAAPEPRRRRGRSPRAGRRRALHAGGRRREGVRFQLGRRPAGQGRPTAQDLGHARPGPTRAPSVANHGSVSVVTKVGAEWKQTKTIAVGGHPSGMTASKNGRFVYVANANSDTVSVIDTGEGRGRRDDRLQAGGEAALRQRLQRPGAQPGWPHALRRQRHQQLRRRRPASRPSPPRPRPFAADEPHQPA